MELTHHFHVPSGVEQTWEHFQDVAALAGCFPGAEVTSVEGDSFTGGCKVKLGPIALVYNGSGTFTERDPAAHRMVVEAKGKDKRGNGTAAATATLTMAAGDGGGTDVDVVTDLAITGKPAQFGRGLMQDVSDRLLGQFVACLQEQVTSSTAAAGESAPSAPAGPEDAAIAAPTAEATAAAPTTPADEQSAAPTGGSTGPAAAGAPSSAPSPSPAPSPRPRVVPPPSAPRDDALDLGRTVLPVLLKSYWKPAAAGAVVVAAIVWLIAR